MALLVQHLLRHVSDTLGGGELPPDLDPISLINQAGEHLHSMHAWRWAQGRAALLDMRGTVSGSDAAWTASTKTLTLASAFTDYSFVAGDEIQVTAGSGTEGFYEIASRVSANAITLATSLSGSDQTDIDFEIQPYSVDLPDDLRDIIAIQATETATRQITLDTLTRVLEAREVTSTNDEHWYAAVSYVGTPPTPILEIGPGSGTSVTGAFRLFYRARWARLGGDATQVAVPEFCEALLVQIVRAFARGYVREDQGSLHQRLAEIQASMIFVAAKRSDGNIQPYHGRLRNGGPTIYRRPSMDWYQTVGTFEPPI